MHNNIYDFFAQSVKKYADRPCLSVEGRMYRYAEISGIVNHIASAIKETTNNGFIGVYVDKSLVCYTGILASLKAGFGYVPINPKLPTYKNSAIVAESKINTIISCNTALGEVQQLLPGGGFQLVSVSSCKAGSKDCELPDVTVLNVGEAPVNRERATTDRKKEDSIYAYLLFTSGSTGVPKGVPITHANVTAYIQNITGQYDFQHTDRFSQVFDLTFDLSVHDLFVCFAAGASLYIPPGKYFSPADYIKRHNITIWFSVPSYASLITRSKVFRNGMFPSLRLSFFCGEPMALTVAEKWQEAAPSSVITNLYGPTETTIAISAYDYNKNGENKSLYGYLSIGKLFKEQQCFLLSETGEVNAGGRGELCLQGSQVANGYWNNSKLSKQKFFRFSDTVPCFITGDIVMQDQEGDLFYIARNDFQVKIRGYRVELEEVNHLIKTAFNFENVVSVPVSNDDGLYDKIYTYLEGAPVATANDILIYCRDRLPFYMVPEKVFFISEFPVNVNGKIDRFELLQMAAINNDRPENG